ncbi:hypothetical protein like AT3G31430 [Hibiscus trionum]|uniref:DUF4283 domain-containing protein n=1 Tax=Hibiscus trionum TaxID=183268 RepID=A0A9W7HWC6_HIBTR|nr:hypothetical protein like AT3G31430 [Hibiscus trionum]
MEENLASLSIEDVEEEAFKVPSDLLESEDEYALCLVGKFLTSTVIHFLAMRNTLADLWHPLGGISITDLGEKRICFRFYTEVDLNRVLEGCPWFFNGHLLLLRRLDKGEDPLHVPLELASFWVQIHNLPAGLMSEGMAKQFGKFIGQFIKYDSKLLITGRKQYMRIKAAFPINTVKTEEKD